MFIEEHGPEGIRDSERPGHPACLDAKQWAVLKRDLRRDNTDFVHLGHLWDGKLMSAHLKQRYRVDMSVRQCERIFRHLGFRPRKPRPQVAKSDPTRVAAFKKLRALAKRKDIS